MCSYPDRLATRHHRPPAGIPFAVHDKDLLETGVDSQPLTDPGVLPRKDDLVYASQSGLEIGHDLLAAHHEDHASGARHVWAQLASGGRGGDEDSSVGEGRHASEHEVRGGDQLANLATLCLAIHRE